MMAAVKDLACARHVDALDIGEVEERRSPEELLVFLANLTQISHLLVHVEQSAVGIVERHGNEVGIEHFLVLVCEVLDVAFLVHLIGNILAGIDNVDGLAVLLLDNSITVVLMPLRIIWGSLIKAQLYLEMIVLII